MDVVTILKDLWKTKDLQQWINNRYQDSNKAIVSKGFLDMATPDFYPDYEVYSWHPVYEYDFKDIRKDDIVLDVGANIGGFAFNVAPYVKKVYAVEPLFISEFNRNLKLNNVNNVHLLEYALTDYDMNLEYEDKIGFAKGKTLSELIKMAGGHVDFLKLDCEGGEWTIKPNELKNIRRIEAEVHSFNNENKDDFVTMLQSLGYDVITNMTGRHMMVHAFLK